ncbi:glucose-1-phosphate adenylyltransferase subunit GlgD [Peptococcaceae bacterium]|nr:glucose-1-phosphate adenylyltransferase subunit GlgD [Peptococcaceae bacterium]
MNINAMGIINLADKNKILKGLTVHRPLAAVPFGCRYRIIDFVLSSMVNSGIKNIGIFVERKSRSLIDHLYSGKDWDLDRKRDGLFIFQCNSSENGSGGFFKYLCENLDYLYKSKQEYVVIAEGNIICNLNFAEILDHHTKLNADVTVVYKKYNSNVSGVVITELSDNGKVIDMLDLERILEPKAGRLFSRNLDKKAAGIYVISKSLLIDLAQICVAKGYYDFVKDGLIKNLSKLNVYAYRYDGYLVNIDSIKNYYRYNMDLLNQDIWKSLFFEPGLIYTKIQDGPPTKYMKNSDVKYSLIANACIIDGVVENSILFRRVKVHKGALIKNSIIMQKTEIEQNAVLENVILDKEVKVTKGKKLIGEKNYPLVVGKGTVI